MISRITGNWLLSPTCYGARFDDPCQLDLISKQPNVRQGYRVYWMAMVLWPSCFRTVPNRQGKSPRASYARPADSGMLVYHWIGDSMNRSTGTGFRQVSDLGRPQYRASDADQKAWEWALRPKRCLLALHGKLQEIVVAKLILDWSPEQVSGWLRTEYPDDESLRVSHETIYRSLFIQARGVLKKELIQHLRFKRRIRRSRHARDSGHRSGQIVDAISIRERPAEIEDRAIPGHWEGDLIGGTKNSHIATLVERHSRFVMLVRVPSKDTATVVAALSQHIGKLPATLRRSLTWDRGLEMAQHKSFTVDTEVKVYFCDPQSPWQRGSNENTNGLLRQYFPKRTDCPCIRRKNSTRWRCD